MPDTYLQDTLALATDAVTQAAGQAGTATQPMASTFSERMNLSLSLLKEIVPALFGALALLFAGYLLAKLLEKGTFRLLRRMHFNSLLERGGVMHAVDRPGLHLNPAKVIAKFFFWLAMFVVLVFAAHAIGLESLPELLTELVSYIPSVLVAILIVIIGIVLGGFVGGLIMASAGGMHGGPTLARVGRGGVTVLAVFMALQELGVATELVTTAFAILFGAVAFALALSFGLGNRELAGEVTRAWYDRYRAEQAAIDREAAADEAEEMAEEAAADRNGVTAEQPVPKAESAPVHAH